MYQYITSLQFTHAVCSHFLVDGFMCKNVTLLYLIVQSSKCQNIKLLLPIQQSCMARPLFPFCVGSGEKCFFLFSPNPTQKGKGGLATQDYQFNLLLICNYLHRELQVILQFLILQYQNSSAGGQIFIYFYYLDSWLKWLRMQFSQTTLAMYHL